MILNKAANQNKALNLLMEDMAVWYPAPYYDIEAMLAEEAKGFKSNARSKVKTADAKRSKIKMTSSSSTAVAYA